MIYARHWWTLIVDERTSRWKTGGWQKIFVIKVYMETDDIV